MMAPSKPCSGPVSPIFPKAGVPGPGLRGGPAGAGAGAAPCSPWWKRPPHARRRLEAMTPWEAREMLASDAIGVAMTITTSTTRAMVALARAAFGGLQLCDFAFEAL